MFLSWRTLTGREREEGRRRDSFIFIDEWEEKKIKGREFVELASFSFLKPFEYSGWFGKWLSRRRRRWRGRGATAPRGTCRPRRRWPATWAPPRAPTRSWRSSRSPHASFAWLPLCLKLRFCPSAVKLNLKLSPWRETRKVYTFVVTLREKKKKTPVNEWHMQWVIWQNWCIQCWRCSTSLVNPELTVSER